MKIVQFGLRFSPNVGDGIISECLEHGLRLRAPGCQVEIVDISGRAAFGQVMVRNRSTALRVLRSLPRPLRHRVVEARLGRLLDRVEQDWIQAARGADLAVVGGGQILSDADLNFCVKLARVADVIRGQGVPSAIFGVGVSNNWSPRGTELFSGLLGTDLRLVGVRDDLSAEAWRAQIGGQGPAPQLTRDPGLLAASCYGPVQAGPRIGLCVTDPDILRYHADASVAGTGHDGLGFYLALAQRICAGGHRLTMFCNGAAEDRAALEALNVRPEVQKLLESGQLSLAAAPETPEQLARIISPLAAVVAHRLHACIIAYSYARPVIGLGWDRKVDSFFRSVDSPDRVLTGGEVTVDAVAGRLDTALQQGIDPKVHARVLDEAWDGIDRLLACASRS